MSPAASEAGEWARPALADLSLPGALALGLGLLGILLAAYFAAHAALGGVSSVLAPGEALAIAPRARSDLIIALVSAYTFTASILGLSAARRDLVALAPALHCPRAELQRLASTLPPARPPLALAMLVGGALGLTLDLVPPGARESDLPAGHWIPSAGLMFTLFGLLGVNALLTMRQSRFFSRLGYEHARVNLLDLGPFAPFSTVGVRMAGYWLVGSALASLLFASSATGWIVASVLVVTVGLGFIALLLPSRGLHLAIRSRKQQELARVRGAIEKERRALLGEAPGDGAGDRMPALLAWESRVESVREWPFDTPTLGRFGLFLLIPLASWVGGALVERIVDAALG